MADGGEKMIELPEYTDGRLRLYRIEDDTSSDFPISKLVDTRMNIWFREISVFDRLRYEFEQGQKEITMKIRIPQYKGIDSKCACEINREMHIVYNATHVKDKMGFPETEITLIRPEKDLVTK